MLQSKKRTFVTNRSISFQSKNPGNSYERNFFLAYRENNQNMATDTFIHKMNKNIYCIQYNYRPDLSTTSSFFTNIKCSSIVRILISIENKIYNYLLRKLLRNMINLSKNLLLNSDLFDDENIYSKNKMEKEI
ncbi:hypothetical protein BpHYR1_011320 [Brachionus plicatilis]|uniref:Uncharacterized protein n=1 Tax=Brachionus plicatilis TaxID=10195 RepID=A0A3M7Q1A1_BRAPC|nr:hypothetical protein BpHYR1_011320 [Brachionus plicatilis]